MGVLNAMVNTMDDEGWVRFDSPSRPSPNAFRTLPLGDAVVLLPYYKKGLSQHHDRSPIPLVLGLQRNGLVKPYFWPVTLRGDLEKGLSFLKGANLAPFLDSPRPARNAADVDAGLPVAPCLPLDLGASMRAILANGLVHTLARGIEQALDVPITRVSIKARRFDGDLATLGRMFVTITSPLPRKDEDRVQKAQWALSLLLDETFPQNQGWISTVLEDSKHSLSGYELRETTLYRTDISHDSESAHEKLQIAAIAQKIPTLPFPERFAK